MVSLHSTESAKSALFIVHRFIFGMHLELILHFYV